MENSKQWSTHIEFLIILMTLVSGIYVLDGKIERQSERQSARTDKLYEMFIEVQNEIKAISIKTSVIETKIEK